MLLRQGRRHILYHRKLGVRWVYLYTAFALPAALTLGQLQLEGVTLLHLPWIERVPHIHSRGQNWQIQDCVHRAASRGYAWALNIDVDEFVILHPQPTLIAFVLARGRWADAFTFGSRNAPTIRQASTANVTCMWRKAGVSSGLCLGYRGMRKHLSRTHNVWTLRIHNVDRCKSTAGCRATHLDAKRGTYLAHLRNDNYDHYYTGMPGSVCRRSRASRAKRTGSHSAQADSGDETEGCRLEGLIAQ